MPNPIIPRTNATFGPGAPPVLLLGEIATNRSTGQIYLGADTGVELVAEKVTSVSRGGTGSTSSAGALSALGAAPIASPAFAGTPTAPTASSATNTDQLATTAFVQANKGDKYKTTSTTSWTIAKNTWTFNVGAGLAYIPSQDVTVVYDANNHAHGTVVSYVGTTLQIEFHSITGSGTYTSWTINVGGYTDMSDALLGSNNLSDVADPASALANLGGLSTSAIIAISRGGTGATTAAAALSALGGAPISSPAFTGTPTAPTASSGTSNTQLATTAFVQANKGDKYRTTSATTWTIAKNTWSFTVPAGLAYTPTQDVTVVYNAGNHAHGTVVSYVNTTLEINFHKTTGSGTYSDWTINVGGFTESHGALLAANNLSDVANPANALANIGGVSTSAIIPVLRGGTGSTSAQEALNVLSGGVGSGLFLGGNGANVLLKAIASSDLPASGVLAGSAGSSMEIPVISVDAKGRVLSLGTAPVPTLALTTVAPAALATAASPGISVEAARADHVHVIPTTTLTGDAAGSGVGSVAVTLATTGVLALTYGSTAAIPVLTVDAKGRITAASTVAPLALTTATAAALGTSALAGISTQAARADHVHQIPFPAINSTASTAYTLNLNDNNDTVQFTAATAVTVTIPTNATAAFPVGSQILLLQYGAGQLTVGGAGVTIRSSGGKLKSGAQYAIMTLLKIATDEWVLGGDIVA
jgi:hypothetical protein